MNLFDTFEKMEFQKFPTKLYTQNIDIIGELLPINHSNLKNNDGKTLLMCLCSNNNIYYDKILDFYNTFNLKYSDYIITDNLGNTAFIYSCMNKNSILAINYFLNELKYNDLITQNNDGNSALMILCQNNKSNEKIFKLFISKIKPTDLVIKNKKGNIALMYIMYYNPYFLNLFIENPKDLIIQNNDGNTPLMYLCYSPSINMIDYDLISFNDFIFNQINKYGQTALIILCMNTNIQYYILYYLINTLLNNDIYIKDNKNKNALNYLSENKYIKIETPCYFSNEKYKLDYYYLFIKDFTCKKNFIDEIGMNEYKLYEKEFDKYFLDKAFDFY